MATAPHRKAATDLAPLLHPGQREVYDCPARFRVLCCGRRWGKTRLAVVQAITSAVRGMSVLWVAPTHKQASIGWRLAKHVAPRASYREVERMILFASGGIVQMDSAERPDNLRGAAADLLVLDETDYMDRDVWEAVLRPALLDRAGRALFISTPRLSDGWFRELFDCAGDDWKSWQRPSWTNPHLPPGEVDAARRSMPELTFRREFGAEFVSAEGARIRKEWLRVGTPPDGMALFMGVDLAISVKQDADYTAAVVVGRDAGGHLWLVRASRIRAGFHEQCAWIAQMARDHGVQAVAVEDVAYQRAAVQELLRTTTLAVVPVRPLGDKVSRFSPIEARYAQGLVCHGPGVGEDFVRELLAFPAGKHDDMVDAFSAAWTILPPTETPGADAVPKEGTDEWLLWYPREMERQACARIREREAVASELFPINDVPGW